MKLSVQGLQWERNDHLVSIYHICSKSMIISPVISNLNIIMAELDKENYYFFIMALKLLC